MCVLICPIFLMASSLVGLYRICSIFWSIWLRSTSPVPFLGLHSLCNLTEIHLWIKIFSVLTILLLTDVIDSSWYSSSIHLIIQCDKNRSILFYIQSGNPEQLRFFYQFHPPEITVILSGSWDPFRSIWKCDSIPHFATDIKTFICIKTFRPKKNQDDRF